MTVATTKRLRLSAEDREAIREAAFRRLSDMREKWPFERPMNDADLRTTESAAAEWSDHMQRVSMTLEGADTGGLRAGQLAYGGWLLSVLEESEVYLTDLAELDRNGHPDDRASSERRLAACRHLLARAREAVA